jgi:acetolactate synthase-1/2/3 large subunit
MADGYARSTGKPGVICLVPGPGVTNSMTGLGEALLDSVPIVCIVGDIAQGEKYRPFQVHSLNQVKLLEPVTKGVFNVQRLDQIPCAIRKAIALSMCGEPGPVAVVIPYPLFIEAGHFKSPPLAPPTLPCDETAFQKAVTLLANRKCRVGIYAGQGCMNYSEALVQVAELLQAPVATSISGKGVMPENHPLSVGWGYGPQGTRTAEAIFEGRCLQPRATGVDLLLAVGVKFSEVSTGFYANPQPSRVIHVDAQESNIGKILRTDVCVHADAGVFLHKLLEFGDHVRRPADNKLVTAIRQAKAEELCENKQSCAKCGVDPMALILCLRKNLPEDAMFFVDVTVSEHLAAEAFRVSQPRTFFNPTDNQGMGWSIPAALGAQKAFPGRCTVTLTGDGCFLMSAMEISTAARAGLPVKFFILDDQAYQFMQQLQKPAYQRTTATILAKLDYAALAKGLGVAYQEITRNEHVEACLHQVFGYPGPVLVRVATDYRDRKIRWVEAVRDRFIEELSAAQKMRFLTRVGYRAVDHTKVND